MAAPIMRAPSGLLQRKCACGTHTVAGGECESCRKLSLSGQLQRAPTQQDSVTEVPSVVHDVLRSPGRSLDSQTRASMEARFGHDFSQVRVHTDSRAAESARAVNALAYTVGPDVVFGAGQYAPKTDAGRKLIAHELTHVAQQRASHKPPAGPLKVDGLDSALEAEAESAERSAPATISASPPGLLHPKSKTSSPAEGRCGGTWACARGNDCFIPDNAIVGPMPPSTWWKLTIKIDIEAPTPGDVHGEDTIGHTYLEFTESNGLVYTYGFYPNPTQKPNIIRSTVLGCVVHPDTNHKGCVDYDEVLTLTEAEYKEALKAAQSLCHVPPPYDLMNFNCTTFVNVIATVAHKKLPAIKGWVGGVVAADNPNTLLEGLRARDAARAKDAGTP